MARALAAATPVAAAGGAGVAYMMQRCYAVPDENLKARPDAKTALVVGGGVVGVATARELARSGFKVRLIEAAASVAEGASSAPAGHIAVTAYHSSFASLGFLRKLGLGTLLNDPVMDHVDEPDDLIHNKFVKLSTWFDWNYIAWGASWANLALKNRQDAPINASVAVQMVQCHKQALLAVAEAEGLTSASDLQPSGGRINVAYHTFHKSGFGMRKPVPGMQRLTAAEVVRREPFFEAAHDDGLVRGGLLGVEDTYGDCPSYVHGLAAKLQQKYGVQVDCGVRATKLETAAGAMTGVRLSTGETAQADVYVLAGGVETPELAMTAGVHLPITAMRGYKLIAPAKRGKAPKSALCVKPYELYVTPLKGEVHFAGFGEFAPRWDDKPTPELEARLEQVVKQVFPAVEDAVDWAARRVVFGRRPQTPDGNQIIGPCRVAGLYLNAGHCSYGFRGATHSAQLLAHGLRGGFESNGIYYRVFTLARFQPLRPAWPRELEDAANLPAGIGR